MEFHTEYVEAGVDGTLGTDTEAASTSAHVDEGCAGSRIRLREAPAAVEKDGTSPVTYAVPDGNIAAPWSMDTERVLAQDISRESAAQSKMPLESYAALTESMNGMPEDSDILNFEGSSFSAVQSGLPAE